MIYDNLYKSRPSDKTNNIHIVMKYVILLQQRICLFSMSTCPSVGNIIALAHFFYYSTPIERGCKNPGAAPRLWRHLADFVQEVLEHR